MISVYLTLSIVLDLDDDFKFELTVPHIDRKKFVINKIMNSMLTGRTQTLRTA